MFDQENRLKNWKFEDQQIICCCYFTKVNVLNNSQRLQTYGQFDFFMVQLNLETLGIRIRKRKKKKTKDQNCTKIIKSRIKNSKRHNSSKFCLSSYQSNEGHFRFFLNKLIMLLFKNNQMQNKVVNSCYTVFLKVL